MFNSFSSFANSLSLDNLQGDSKSEDPKLLDEFKQKLQVAEQENSSLSKSLHECSTEVNALKKTISELQRELDEKTFLVHQQVSQQAITSVEEPSCGGQEELTKYKQRCLELSQQNSELHNQLSDHISKFEIERMQFQSRIKELELQSENLAGKCESNEEILRDKEKSIEDYQTKLKTVTEKFKDMMKKYADLVSKSQSQEQSLTQANEMLQSFHTKDSEILSLRLKLERLEEAAAEKASVVNDVGDRNTQLQKECLYLKNELEAAWETASRIEAARCCLTEYLEMTSSDRDGWHEEYRQLQHLQKGLCIEHVAAQANAAQEFNAEISALKEQVRVLSEQNSELSFRLKNEVGNFMDFEEYKKRAQLALKKANAANAQMSATLAENEESLRVLQEEFKSSQQLVNDLSVELEESKQCLALERSTTERCREEMARAKQRWKEDEEKYEAKLMELSRTTIATEPFVFPASQSDPAAAAAANSLEDSPSSSQESKRSTGSDHENFGGNDLDHQISEVSKNSFHPHNSVVSGDTKEGGDNNEEDEAFVSKSSQQFILVTELQRQLELCRKEISDLQKDNSEFQRKYEESQAEVKRCDRKLEELRAYFERAKSLQGGGEDSQVNSEYLKNCVYRYLATTDLSERQRLLPVICTILKLTSHERTLIDQASNQNSQSTLESTIDSWSKQLSWFG